MSSASDQFQFELLLEQSDLIFFVIDLDYKYLNFSQKHFEVMKDIWGVEITVGMSILDVITHPEDKMRAKNNFDKAILEKKSFFVEEYFGDEFLVRKYYKDNYIPLIEDGNVSALLITVEEIHNTQTKKIFEQIINLAKNGVALSDATKEDNPLIFVNRGFEEITGYDKSEVLGKNCRFLQKNDINQDAKLIIKDAIKNQKSCEVEIRNYKKDGTLFYNLLVLSPIFDSTGKILYFVGIQNDITTIKQSREFGFQKKQSESLANLIKNISHQWRQPLSEISILAGTLQLKEELRILDSESLFQSTTKIVQTTQYLSTILKEFGDFLISGDKTKFHLFSLVNSVISDNIENVHCMIDIDKDIEIINYQDLLLNSFKNLLDNSLLALQNVDEKYIQIVAKKVEDKIIIYFKDNGGGIDENILNLVFDPYFTTKHQSQGTGLGLYLIQTFLKNIDGTISIENRNMNFNGKDYMGVMVTLTFKAEI